MSDLQGFNANEVEPMTEFEPVPAGQYMAAIVASEMKPNKAGTGRFLELKFTILEGEHRNRNLWSRLNLENPSPKAVQIARGELSAICRATGVMTPRDSCELHNLPLTVSVRLKPRQDTGELSNVVSGYKPKEAAASAPSQEAGSVPPWRR